MMSLKASLMYFSASLRHMLSQRTKVCLQLVNRWQMLLGKNLEIPFCAAWPCTEEHSQKACVISNIFVSLVACLILSFPGHLHSHYCFKMSADSTFKIASLFSILTGSLGQADMVVMNHRGGKESHRAM